VNYFGQDFGLDLNLIKRVEIIRGPSSALYGTNGMFATINIVTKSPVEYDPLQVSAEVDSFGERKGQISGSKYLGRGANLLVSVSIFNNAGESRLYFLEFDNPATNNGWAVNMDGERGYHTFANLIWNNWSFLAYFGNREKVVPTAWFGTIFNNRGDTICDGRGFLESAYQRDIGTDGKLRWRLYYDRYRYTGRFEFAGDSVTLDGRNVVQGDWVGSELTYRFRVPVAGYLTVGADTEADLRARATAYYAAPIYTLGSSIEHLDRSAAVFFQDEWSLSRKWTLYLGGRLDDSRIHSLMLTPRAALIYQPSERSALKLLYGRSFRNPSEFEEFYTDGISQIANPALDSERMQTFEIAFEKTFRRKFVVEANAYHYQLGDLIAAALLDGYVQQYRNMESTHANGLELEARAPLWRDLKLEASLAVQKTSSPDGFLPAVNSPARIGKLLVDKPLWKGRFALSGALQYLSERTTLAGNELPPFYRVNLALSSRRLPGDVQLQAGILNLLNHKDWSPAGTVQESDRIEQEGRSFFLRISWSASRESDGARKSKAGTQGGQEH